MIVEPAGELRAASRDALAALNVDRFVLAIHDSAFPADAGEDLGRGTPYGRGGARLCGFVARHGFDGLQLGPQGEISAANPSPYDGSVFSRSRLLLPPGLLVELGLVPAERVEALVVGRGRGGVRERVGALLEAACAGLPGRGDAARELADYRAREAAWLERDGLFEALAAAHGHDDWRRWPELDRRLCCPAAGEGEAAAARRIDGLRAAPASGAVITRHALAQWLLDQAHARLRRLCGGLGLRLYGDLQIGLGPRDVWAAQALLMRDYLMGAPPSRTNPEGQPWAYAVLEPALYGTREAPGPAARYAAARLARLLAGFDGLRIDHPHGWVCPWVYRRDAAERDAYAAVRAGARLFSSPALADHPALAAYALARPEQLDESLPRHADARVRELEPAQLDGYARLFDLLVAEARAAGREVDDLACEILSTCPMPLGAVLARHGLGQFRILQKARLDDATDVYRAERAQPADWVMIGNHDTPTAAGLHAEWSAAGGERLRAWARHLAERLVGEEGAARAAFAARVASSPAALAEAMLAELLSCPARHVLVAFGDLFGEREPFNRPGVVDARNWTQRLPGDFEALWAERMAAGEAPSIGRALALALRAPGAGGEARQALAARLEALVHAEIRSGR